VHPSNGSNTQLTVDGAYIPHTCIDTDTSLNLLVDHPAAPPLAKGPPRQNFSFDRVIGPEDGQASVYEAVEP